MEVPFHNKRPDSFQRGKTDKWYLRSYKGTLKSFKTLPPHLIWTVSGFAKATFANRPIYHLTEAKVDQIKCTCQSSHFQGTFICTCLCISTLKLARSCKVHTHMYLQHSTVHERLLSLTLNLHCVVAWSSPRCHGPAGKGS